MVFPMLLCKLKFPQGGNKNLTMQYVNILVLVSKILY